MKMKFVREMVGISLSVIALNAASNSKAVPVPMRIDCLMVANARIELNRTYEDVVATSPLRHLRLANYGQEIAAGSLNVLAIRIFEDDGSGVDSQKFSKITLELVSGKSALSNATSERVLVSRGYYSHGGIGFIPRGEYWWARDPIKNIKFSQTSKGLIVTVNSSFLATKALNGEKKKMVVDLTCPVRSLAVNDLEPWEGRVGTSWSSFGPKQRGNP